MLKIMIKEKPKEMEEKVAPPLEEEDELCPECEVGEPCPVHGNPKEFIEEEKAEGHSPEAIEELEEDLTHGGFSCPGCGMKLKLVADKEVKDAPLEDDLVEEEEEPV